MTAAELVEHLRQHSAETPVDDGYVSRVMPYVWRIIWTVGVMLLVFASWPLGRMLRARAQERGK